MKKSLGLVLLLTGCAAVREPSPATFNEKMLEQQQARIKKGESALAEDTSGPTGDPQLASLWTRANGSPYLIRNQKAQNVGDLLTIEIEEKSNATTSAKTDTKKDSKSELGGSLNFGQGDAEDIASLSAETNNKNEFKGEGKTDRCGELTATVQAVVENVLQNGTLFVRGRKTVTINNEDQEIEITGFVRPDDIRINNTIISSLVADAKIRYVGDGVISDKQRTGWGTRLLDAVWPF